MFEQFGVTGRYRLESPKETASLSAMPERLAFVQSRAGPYIMLTVLNGHASELPPPP
jgi:hypothetical protein